MSAIAILTAARARIADPAHWTTGAFARDAAGHPVEPDDPSACRWCAYGSVHAEGGAGFGPECDLLRRAARAVHDDAVVIVNDHHGHTAVLAVYDRAIAQAAQAEAA